MPSRIVFTVATLCAGLVWAAEPATTTAGPQGFDSDGVRIHYTDEGGGEPVILIHGFATNHEVNWATVIPALRGDYRIVALDNRGHGRSERPAGDRKYGLHMVEDVRRLMDHLQLRQAHVVGYSMGGMIAGKFLAEHPDRVTSAVIGGISCTEPDDRWRECMASTVTDLEAGRGLGPLFDFLGQNLEPAVVAGMKANVPPAADQAFMAACIRQFPEFAVPEEKLAANTKPAVAIIGDKDPFKAAVDRMNACMGNLDVVVIPGADHISAFADPRFARAIRRFLDEHRRPE